MPRRVPDLERLPGDDEEAVFGELCQVVLDEAKLFLDAVETRSLRFDYLASGTLSLCAERQGVTVADIR